GTAILWASQTGAQARARQASALRARPRLLCCPSAFSREDSLRAKPRGAAAAPLPQSPAPDQLPPSHGAVPLRFPVSAQTPANPCTPLLSSQNRRQLGTQHCHSSMNQHRHSTATPLILFRSKNL